MERIPTPNEYKISALDLSCKIYLSWHVPMVFTGICVLALLFKARVMAFAFNLNFIQYKKTQKSRTKSGQLVLKVIQVVTLIVIAGRYIDVCRERDADPNFDRREFVLEYFFETYVALGFKVAISLYVAIKLIWLSKNKHMEGHKGPLWFMFGVLILSAANDLASISLLSF
jgi:hypothetical protein